MKNCPKYDLGRGYRLITFKRGISVFILFLGTHDESQRCLNNGRLKAPNTGKERTIHISDKIQSPLHLSAGDETGINADDAVVLQNLTDKDLRSVFNGLG